MAEAQKPSGPDLKAGIPLSDLRHEVPLLGHADGEAVVLVRRGQEVFALGAACTHYGGPLAEGLVVGDTIRCPWHHACFDLRTGEAMGAPALNPVRRWSVQRTGDRIRVTGAAEPEPTPRKPAGKHPSSIVILGAGAAGNAAAEMLRRLGFEGPVLMIGAEDELPSDRPNLSKDYLAGNAPEEWIPLRQRDFYRDQRIDLRLGVAATGLDPATRELTLADRTRVRFDTLLLATGAEPVRLPLPGADRPHVHCLRTVADSRGIIRGTEGAKRAVVMGASFIGLEVAASLRARGLEVHVVAPDDRPLERVLGAPVGDFIRRLHEAHGVQFHLGQTAKEVGESDVTLANGDRIPAELVVIGAGVRPRLALAEQAGLAMDRGVLVNRYLETSAPGVFAAGDIARYPDPWSGESIRVEHWVVAERQGQAAARNMLGAGEPYRDPPFFWSAHYDVAIAYVGHAAGWDDLTVEGRLEDHDATVIYRHRNRVRAVATIFRDQVSLRAEAAMEHLDEKALTAALAP
ncbi:MAG: FAD-dependent oxidoreductase [Gemmatimonadales bacterium]